jgi:predicted dehydrogenase
MLRAAIVGLGRWGQVLVNAVQEEGRPKGEYICFTCGIARTPLSASEFATRQKLRLGSDLGAALADPAIDAVVLATPHSQHAEQIAAAATAGKHVFCEKPLTLSKQSAEAAVRACERAGVVLALGHNRRFLPAMAELKSIVESDALGALLHIEGNMSGPGALSYAADRWRASADESPAGGMTGMGIHVVDAMIHLLGEIASVQTQSFRRALAIEIDDTTSILLRFRNGCSGYLGTMAATAPTWRLHVFGSKGRAEMRNPTTIEITGLDGKTETRSFPETDIERAELEAFARAVTGEAPYPLPADQAVHGVAVLQAIVASARNGSRAEVA